jgi:Tol biopolymer transport system component
MRSLPRMTLWPLSAAVVLAAVLSPGALVAQNGTLRPMSFLDVRHMRQAATPVLSPDGKWALYTLSVPNWKEAKSYSDIYVVSAERGSASTRQLTFTRDKNETNPRWTRDGAYFVFSSNRDAPNNGNQQQLYVMRPDGGEAMKVTDAKDGVGQFAFTRDGRWLLFSAGKADEQQIWALPASGMDTAKAVQVTRHATPIRSWILSNDGQRLFFIAPDSLDKDDKIRREKQFTVNIRNQPAAPEHVWVLDLGTRQEKRLTSDASFSVSTVTVSPDGKWLGVNGIKNDRYARNVTEQGINGDLYLVDATTGDTERLTNNVDIGESRLSFSPDGEWIAFTAANDMKYFRDGKLYLRRRADKGAQWRKLGGSYDGDVNVGWWSKDGKTIYFSDGVKATTQLLALDVERDVVRQITDVKGVVSADRDDETGLLQITYADPRTPNTHFIAAEGDVTNESLRVAPAHQRQSPAGDRRVGRGGRDQLEVEGRKDRRRRAREARRLSARKEVPARRRDPWRPGRGRPARIQWRLRIADLRRRRLCRPDAELSRVDQLW